jgi:hypothetical protein
MDSGGYQDEDAGSDFEVEVADISHSGRLRSSQHQGAGRSPGRRVGRLLTTMGIVTLVLLVLGLDLTGRLTPQQFLAKPSLPLPLTLRPQAQGVNCLVDAAWSPQDTRIALLGDKHAPYCPAASSGHKAGIVLVYDATSGTLLATVHPDDGIVRAIEAFAQQMAPKMAPTSTPPSAAQIAAAIAYEHVLWSPDGRQLALTFSLAVTSIGLNLFLPDGEPENLQGVLLLETNGAHSQVILQPESAYAYATVAVEWDLHAGTIVATAAAPSSYPTFGMLMPAVAYRWQTETGAMPTPMPTPVAATVLSTAAPPPVPPLGPVGNPDGGSSFTVWQPAVVTGIAQSGPDGQLTHLPGVYELSASFMAWSPDGRYLLDTVIPEGVLELPDAPTPTQDQLSAYGIDGLPQLPLRDVGLAQALRAVNPVNSLGASIAWRPDGRVLAAYAPANVFAVPRVTVYDCATGRQLTALLPPALGATSVATPLMGQVTLLRWSPDGTHLLLYALPLGQVVLWGPQQLPR